VRITTGLNLFPRLKMGTAVLALTSKPPKREQGNFYLLEVKFHIIILNNLAKE
jgi:hypothetical protein